ncbi:MAG: hypothetical protein IJ575_01590 [Selenomonadaceae bacterium]|nr:hypothetical protein [Selenomonadaceae bacterium]
MLPIVMLACAFRIEDIPNFKNKIDRSKFYDEICRYRDEKKISESKLYNSAGISRAIFSNIRNMRSTNYTPSKPTVLALCIKLKLNLEQSQDLLALVGYCLSNNSIEDKIIAYCIKKNIAISRKSIQRFSLRLANIIFQFKKIEKDP